LREQELANELIQQLLRANSPRMRTLLAEKFGNNVRLPRTMAMNLACDAIDVAGKVLMSCETLTDTDLITVIDSQSRDHAAAIAHRQSLNEAVADALVVTGDTRIMEIVANNLGAKFSSKAVTIVADAARFAAELREPVIKRPEMKTDVALRLYWWISHDLRRYTLKRFGISSGQIDQALAKTIEDLLGYHQLDKAKDDVMMQVADWLEERQALSSKILPQILRLGHFRLFNIALSRLTNMDIKLIDTIVAEDGGRELAVVCRALGIDKPGFVSIFLLSRGARPDDQIVHPRELTQALVAFDRLTTNLAHDLLRSWRANPAYLQKNKDEVVLEA
jgi:uncharacterized protein (DUF2336 family)